MTLRRTLLAVALAAGCAALPLAAQAQPWQAHGPVASSRAAAEHGDRVDVRYRGGGRSYRGRPGPGFRYDVGRWRGGYWDRGWHDGRFAWWWVVDDFWFDYPGPIYPYPVYAYQEPVYVQPAPAPVYQTQPAYQPPPPAESNWYYCDNPRGYYPYVTSCPSGWRTVPSTPPDR